MLLKTELQQDRRNRWRLGRLRGRDHLSEQGIFGLMPRRFVGAGRASAAETAKVRSVDRSATPTAGSGDTPRRSGWERRQAVAL